MHNTNLWKCAYATKAYVQLSVTDTHPRGELTLFFKKFVDIIACFEVSKYSAILPHLKTLSQTSTLRYKMSSSNID